MNNPKSNRIPLIFPSIFLVILNLSLRSSKRPWTPLKRASTSLRSRGTNASTRTSFPSIFHFISLVPVYSEYLSLYLPPLWVDVMAKAYAHKLEDQIYHSLAQPKELTSPINPKSNPVLLNYKSAYSERYKQLRMALYHHEPLPIPELQEFTPSYCLSLFSMPSYFSSSPVLMEYVHALYTPYLYPNCKTHIVKHLYSSLYSHMKEDLKTLSRKEVSTKYIDILRKQIELKQPYFSLVQSSTPE